MEAIKNIMLPVNLLKIEGAVLLLISIGVYGWSGSNWLLFIVLLVAIDLSMLGYTVSPIIGAIFYNLFHLTVWPLLLIAYSMIFSASSSHDLSFQLALIWFAHVGMDRLIGAGLKYPTRFNDTHMQHV